MSKKQSTTKKKKKLQSGILKVNATKNNVFFTLTNNAGDVYFSLHCGLFSYRNARKHTPAAIRTTFEKMKEKMTECSLKEFKVILNGYGSSLNEVLVLLPTLPKEPTSYSYTVNRMHNGTTAPRLRSV